MHTGKSWLRPPTTALTVARNWASSSGKLAIYSNSRSTTMHMYSGRRKRTLHLYAVTATNLGLLRANAETSHSVRVGPGGGWLCVVGGGEKFSDGEISKTTTVGPLQFSYYTALLLKHL